MWPVFPYQFVLVGYLPPLLRAPPAEHTFKKNNLIVCLFLHVSGYVVTGTVVARFTILLFRSEIESCYSLDPIVHSTIHVDVNVCVHYVSMSICSTLHLLEVCLFFVCLLLLFFWGRRGSLIAFSSSKRGMGRGEGEKEVESGF